MKVDHFKGVQPFLKPWSPNVFGIQNFSNLKEEFIAYFEVFNTPSEVWGVLGSIL